MKRPVRVFEGRQTQMRRWDAQGLVFWDVLRGQVIQGRQCLFRPKIARKGQVIVFGIPGQVILPKTDSQDIGPTADVGGWAVWTLLIPSDCV